MIQHETKWRAQSKYRASLPQLKSALAQAGVKGRWVQITNALVLFECESGGTINLFYSSRAVFFSGRKSERDRLEALLAPNLKVRKTNRSPSTST
jgi:hypothetical protein